jgi:leader peptidase (prepilin peptidase)/N-methyltransferase
MMLAQPGADQSGPDLRPNLILLLAGTGVLAVVSWLTLPWQLAAAATGLGAMMIAGADIDARTFLLPDAVTLGTAAGGVAAAGLLDPFDPLLAVGIAVLRAAATSLALGLFRWGYGRLSGREGIGLGDVKLAAAIGAWLPVDAIPQCFAIATGGALVAVLLAHLRGRTLGRTSRIPFGAFLCPALWIVFYAGALSS